MGKITDSLAVFTTIVNSGEFLAAYARVIII